MRRIPYKSSVVFTPVNPGLNLNGPFEIAGHRNVYVRHHAEHLLDGCAKITCKDEDWDADDAVADDDDDADGGDVFLGAEYNNNIVLIATICLATAYCIVLHLHNNCMEQEQLTVGR